MFDFESIFELPYLMEYIRQGERIADLNVNISPKSFRQHRTKFKRILVNECNKTNT